MKLLKLLFKRETVAPMLALMFASAVSVALVFTRIVWTGNFHYGFLVWNLILAWMPLCFALLAREQYRQQGITNEPTPSPSKEGSRNGERRTTVCAARRAGWRAAW